MFTLDIDPKELAKLNKGVQLRRGLLKGVKKGMLFAEGEAKKSFGRPGNLKVRSGHLRRSIKTSVKETGDTVQGIIGSNVIYAAIHEFGGMAGRGLKSKIPARPFLKPALEDNVIAISRIIQKEIAKEVKKNAGQ